MEAKQPYFNQLLCIFLIYALDSFGIALAYPIFTPIFLSEATEFFNPSTSIVVKTLSLGILLAVFPMAQFFSVPFIGEFSDRSGRKKTFSFTLLGSALSYFLAALAIFRHSLLLLFFSRISSGIFAGNTSLCFASLSDLSSSFQERSKYFGFLAAFGGLSFFFAIFCGQYFFNEGVSFFLAPSFPFLFLASACLFTWGAVHTLFKDPLIPCRKEPFHFAQGYQHIVSSLNTPSLRHAYLTYFFFALGWISMMQFYPLNLMQTYHKKPLEFTINLVLVGLMWSLSNFIGQKFLCKRFSPKQILTISLPLLVILLLSCSLTQSYLSFTLHFSLSVSIAALTWTNCFANVSLSASKEVQGRIMGINQSFSSIATIGATLGGSLVAAFSPPSIFLLGAASTACAFHFLYKKKPSEKK